MGGGYPRIARRRGRDERGAYGHSLQEVLVGARLADGRGEVTELSPADLELSYRNSGFTSGKLRDQIVLSVDIRLQQGDPDRLKERVKQLDAQRRGAQPPGRNCGSVFKNPSGTDPPGSTIEDVGLRGHRIGNAVFSEKHSNFIQKTGDASAKDITDLIALAGLAYASVSASIWRRT